MQKRKKRVCWIKSWLNRRQQLGIYDTLLQELRFEYEEDYKKYLRMNANNFDEILSIIANDITKQDTNMREAIPPKIKLAATLRFLSTGATYSDLQFEFRVHKSTLGKFIPEVCEVIYKRLKDDYMKVS